MSEATGDRILEPMHWTVTRESLPIWHINGLERNAG